MNMFKPSAASSTEEYLSLIDEPRKSDIVKLDEFIKATVPEANAYFASNMLGYGKYHYKSKSGREGDWPVIALASQKNYISLYVCSVKDGTYIAELYKKNLPKAEIGKSCIRFKKLEDVDLKVIGEILKYAVKHPLN
jgi:hypothetical protein